VELQGETRPDDGELRALMRAYQAGEMAAFERLHRSLAPELLRYLAARAGDVERARDLLQETFLHLHKARHTYDSAWPLRPWAFAIARHVHLMERRSRLRRGAHEHPAPVEALDPAAAGQAQDAFGRRLLRQLLARLDPERRAPLVLHRIFGLSYREIGRRLGIREGAARLRASRALSELRGRAAEEEQE
jgi:RNA polymerase sigma-70 factor (ECF subfamily)